MLCFLVWFQLIVGSEDFDIRVFREDEIIAEMTETEVSDISILQVKVFDDCTQTMLVCVFAGNNLPMSNDG